MRHDLHLPGYAFRLRPVCEADAAYIVDLRRRAGIFLNRGAQSEEAQLQWLARYFERAGDYYFVVETIEDAHREGLVSVYDVCPSKREAEWGRWVLEPGSNGAVESALLVYRCAFECLHLEAVRCRTLAANAAVIAFHDSCGLARGADKAIVEHDGERCSAIEHVLSRTDWPFARERLDKLARRFAGTIARATARATAS